MNKTKKMNTYIKYGLTILACAVVGGILGYSLMHVEGELVSFENIASQFLDTVKKYMLPELIILLIAEILVGEICIRKAGMLGSRLTDAEDEEGDQLDYEIEKITAAAQAVLMVIAFLSIVIVSTGYSIKYIKTLDEAELIGGLMAAFLTFVVIYIYHGYWGVRLIKLQQKLDPAKKGDPASAKFTEQWVESCDEAEKELIYQSAYRSYLVIRNVIPMLLLVSMLAHLMWNTGIMAVFCIGLIWMIQTVTYLKSSVKKKGQKLYR